VKKIALWFAVAVAVFGAGMFYASRHATPFIANAAQVDLDGTPVCVFQVEGQLVAAVGRCEGNPPDSSGQAPDLGGPHGAIPGPNLPPGHPPIGGGPGMNGRLPPGHPPIGLGVPDGGDRLLI
jgi:hypothetical protein